MIKVLIIDDEPLVRIGIKSTLALCDLEVEVVGEASNGVQAIDIINSREVGLIFVDIKMPEMNGLELIRWIKQNGKNIKVIVLSCYNDFEYVREAFTLGASDYILKYDVDSQSINKVLQKVKTEIEKEKSISGKLEDGAGHDGKIFVDLKILKNNLFREIFSGNPDYDYQFVKEQFENLHCNLSIDGEFRILCVKIDDVEGYNARMRGKTPLQCNYEIINAISEYLMNLYNFEIYPESIYSYYVIVDLAEKTGLPQSTAESIDHAGQIKYLISKYLNISVSIGISQVKRGYGELQAACEQALKSAENRFIFGPGHIEYFDRKKQDAFRLPDMDKINSIKAEIIKEISSEDFGEIVAHLDNLKKEFLSANSISVTEIRLTYISIFEITKVQFFNELQLSKGTDLREMGKSFERIVFLDELHDRIMNLVMNLANVKVGTLPPKNYSEGVMSAISYINTHYSDEDINLNVIAVRTSYSASYLSRIFKQETGMYLIEYINEVRIQQAKKMLKNPGSKVYQVAEKVGYNNYNYFSKIFKRQTGISPSEYS